MEKVKLGKTGLQVTKAGFGVLTVGATQLDLSVERGSSVLRYALERGINFLDTAQYYDTYPFIREALKGTNYEPVISSKCLGASYKAMVSAVEEARKALDRDVIDIFLLHEVRSERDFRLRSGAWEALGDLKAKGVIKHIGLSTHHTDVAELAAHLPECEILFPLINFKGLGIRCGSSAGTKENMASAIAKAHKSGKGVFAMKVFGGGNLTGSYTDALNYVYGLEGIDSAMIGFGKEKEIDDIISYLDGKLPAGYTPDISMKRLHVDQGDCEGCASCISHCASGAIYINKKTGLADIDHSKCITCGYCAAACPVRAIIMIDR